VGHVAIGCNSAEEEVVLPEKQTSRNNKCSEHAQEENGELFFSN